MRVCSKVCLAPLLIAVAMAAGCAKKEEPKITTQVAARVNAEEITVHQVNNILARTPNVKPENADRAKREILAKLIDQQLAKQAAIEKKLDRSPNVMQAIEAAQSEILARSYLAQVAAAQPKPTAEAVKKYYTDHPELFAQRRIFNLEEIVVLPTEGLAARLQEQVAKARSMQDIATWLKSQDIKFVANSGVRAAESLPMELLPKLQAVKDGEFKLIEANGGLQIFRVVASKAAPVDETTATPRIQQFLFNRHASEVAAAEIKRLRDKAKITYVGEFADSAAAAEAKTKAEAEARAKELAGEKAKAEAEAESQARVEEISKARKAAEEKVRLEAEASAEKLAQARRAAEAKARAEAEEKAKAAPSKPAQLPQENIEKGLRGLK